MRLLLFLFLTILTTSCAQRMYFPDKAATFSFTKAGEAVFNSSVKLQSIATVPAPNADAAYAVTNHILVFAAYRTVNGRHISEIELDYANRPDEWPFGGTFKGRRWEAGAGYFSSIGRLGFVEILAGYGRGTLSKAGEMDKNFDFESAYHRMMIQAAAGTRLRRENFQLIYSGGIRVAGQRFHRFVSPDPDLRYNIAEGRADILTDIPRWVEPFLNLEVGGQWFLFSGQTGATVRLAGPSVSGSLPLYVTLGFAVRLPLNQQKGIQ